MLRIPVLLLSIAKAIACSPKQKKLWFAVAAQVPRTSVLPVPVLCTCMHACMHGKEQICIYVMLDCRCLSSSHTVPC